jgi:hypothetical protein
MQMIKFVHIFDIIEDLFRPPPLVFRVVKVKTGTSPALATERLGLLAFSDAATPLIASIQERPLLRKL